MEGEDRRDRLAQLNLERMQRPPARGWRAAAERASDGWEHFFAFAGWEKTVYIGGTLIAIVVALSVAILFIKNATGGSDTRLPSASLPDVRTSPSATPARSTPTTVLVGAAELATPQLTAEPNRENCNAIRGTEYQSDAERAWFLGQCSTSDAPTAPKKAPPTSAPVGGETPATAPPPSGLTSSEAVLLATDWIQQHTQYATASSCATVRTGNHWVVACQGAPPGCDSGACQGAVSVCVFSDPTRVVASAQC